MPDAKTCTMPTCKEQATETRYAIDGGFALCSACADEVEAKGYRRQPWNDER